MAVSDIVVIGGGPQGLSVLCGLHEHAYSSTFQTDAGFKSRIGYDGHKKVGRVHVIDPGSNFMEGWNSRFEMLQIEHLRSDVCPPRLL